MRHGSLFSGIDGFGLASEWMGWENVFQVEIDGFCQKVLAKNFPNVKRYGDIKEFDGSEYRGIIDILTGGFPCQGFSVAGKQRGKNDPRWLWPEMFRVIREIQPPWVVGENVPGIIKLALEDICLALESEGYAVQPFIIPSAGIGAWDKRERVWIIAYNHQFGCNNEQKKQRETLSDKIRVNETSEQVRKKQQCRISKSDFIPSNLKEQRVGGLSIQQWGQNETQDINPDREIKINPNINKFNSNHAGYNSGTISQQQEAEVQFNNNIIRTRLQGYSRNDLSSREKEQERSTGQANWLRDWIEVASELCRSNARIPHRMDRIKGLGNSVNPYVPFQIFKAIEDYDNQATDQTAKGAE